CDGQDQAPLPLGRAGFDRLEWNARDPAMRLARQAHLVVSFLFVAGVAVQVFLAGLGVFDSPSMFQTHAAWGYLLELLPLILLALAVVGRLGRRQILSAAALLGMFFLQSVFVAVR